MKKILFALTIIVSAVCVIGLVGRFFTNSSPERQIGIRKEKQFIVDFKPVALKGRIHAIKDTDNASRVFRDVIILCDIVPNLPVDSCDFYTLSGRVLRIRIPITYLETYPGRIFEGYSIVKEVDTDSLLFFDQNDIFVRKIPLI